MKPGIAYGFNVVGEPVAKERPRHSTTIGASGRTFSRTYTPIKTVNYEISIGLCAKAMMTKHGFKPTALPVKLEAVFNFQVPKSWPQWKQKLAVDGQIAHTVKPDSDNVEKAIKDAMNDIVFLDDAQVVHTQIHKRWCTGEGSALVTVTPLKKLPAQIKNRQELDELTRLIS